MRFTRNPENWLKRTMGAPPMSDNSQYSKSCQAVGATTGSQSDRAAGAAEATQRTRVIFQRDFWVLKTALKSQGVFPGVKCPRWCGWEAEW